MGRALAVLLAATLASLALLETGVRALVADPSAGLHFAVRSRSCCRLDARLLWTFVPGASGTWSTEEFTETTHVNSLGLRGEEPAPHPPGAPTILAAGDSFTYGHGMSDADAYPAVLQTLLRARGLAATVLNAGQPGYGSDQTYRGIVERWLALAPDVVLFGIHCSDVGYDADMSLYDLDGGRLVELPTWSSWVLLQGRVLGALPRPLRKLRSVQALLGTLERADPFGRLPYRDEPELGAWLRAKIAVQLEDLTRRGRDGGFAVLAVVMPCKQDLVGGDRAIYGDLVDRLDGAGVRRVDVGAEMRARGVAGRDVFFARDWHLDARGNRLLAEIVAAAIADDGGASAAGLRR
ncbi:MAG: hypothetical protein AB1689_20990 [Thermodesulfobacteriota bacterium]